MASQVTGIVETIPYGRSEESALDRAAWRRQSGQISKLTPSGKYGGELKKKEKRNKQTKKLKNRKKIEKKEKHEKKEKRQLQKKKKKKREST